MVIEQSTASEYSVGKSFSATLSISQKALDDTCKVLIRKSTQPREIQKFVQSLDTDNWKTISPMVFTNISFQPKFEFSVKAGKSNSYKYCKSKSCK